MPLAVVWTCLLLGRNLGTLKYSSPPKWFYCKPVMQQMHCQILVCSGGRTRTAGGERKHVWTVKTDRLDDGTDILQDVHLPLVRQVNAHLLQQILHEEEQHRYNKKCGTVLEQRYGSAYKR